MLFIAEESECRFAFILRVEGPAAGEGRVWGLPTEGRGGGNHSELPVLIC